MPWFKRLSDEAGIDRDGLWASVAMTRSGSPFESSSDDMAECKYFQPRSQSHNIPCWCRCCSCFRAHRCAFCNSADAYPRMGIVISSPRLRFFLLRCCPAGNCAFFWTCCKFFARAQEGLRRKRVFGAGIVHYLGKLIRNSAPHS